MVPSFLDHIRTLLHSPEVEVSYFAAGILAHLTSRGEKAWTLSPVLRFSLLEQLVGIQQKCFKAVDLNYMKHLFCFHFAAASRYCSMLLEEGGLDQLEHVHTNPQTHRDVKLLAESILENLQRHRTRTGQPAHTSRRPPPQ
ncbi:hypothetical protein XENOCAPTIV_009948 [Xenoophorus captivus]|uniref:Protein zer-1 homolog-like C-terminal domain-containing protein n=1 Tax=Xenoophorus captivus TaxID=1517983 RepID=A0ABV0SGE0_9TELE